MRLWHKELIPVLPRQQLLAQWRECCCIAKNIAIKGTPNHILVNKILEYPIGHFQTYCELVIIEMGQRGYEVKQSSYKELCDNISIISGNRMCKDKPPMKLYEDWHSDRYFWQCYFNLQEKYDCEGIPEEEWQEVENLAANKERMEYYDIKKEEELI